MSADNAIAILRTNRGAGSGYKYRLAEFGVSGEPFDRVNATKVTKAKGLYCQAERDLIESGSQDASAFEAAEKVVTNGFVSITFHDAQYFVSMFANSPVFNSVRAAQEEAARMRRRTYVEYGTERVAIDATWTDIKAQAEVLRQRRLTCMVLGPDAPKQRTGNWDTRPDFMFLGGPGIEDKLAKWGWSAELIAEAMKKVHSMYFNERTYREAENLRFAREGNTAEMERYERSKAKGCCTSHDESFDVDVDFEGEVRVHFGFNFGH